MVLSASRNHFYDWIPAFAGMTAYWIIWVETVSRCATGGTQGLRRNAMAVAATGRT